MTTDWIRMYPLLEFNICHMVLELSFKKDNVCGPCGMNGFDKACGQQII